MNRKQFVIVVAALVVLIALGWGVVRWERGAYEVADSRVGKPLLEGFRVDDVAQIELASPTDRVTLVRADKGWTVKERGGYPANIEPIRNLLVRLEEQKVVQAEGIGDSVRPRLQLVAPAAGTKPEETGMLVELKGRDGKTIAQLVLGKTTQRESPMPGMPGTVPSGRYVWLAADPQRMNVVPEPFSNVQAKPDRWLVQDYLQARRVQSLAVSGPDGKERWAIVRPKETDGWKWTAAAKLDSGKAQDGASALYSMRIADVAPDISDADAGLDKPVVVRAQTFDGWNYELRIGKPAPGDRYYVRGSVTGAIPETRTPPAGEKPEEKQKADKAFTEQKNEQAAKLAREQALGSFTVLVAKSEIDPLLRDRTALVAVPKKDGKGKHQ